MNSQHVKKGIIGCVAVLGLGIANHSAAAQDAQSIEVGAQVAVSRFRELDSTDIGIGGRVSWHPSGWIGIDGELTVYPRDMPDVRPAISRSRVEGLFGVTAGPRLNKWRPFARIRPGFLRVGASPEPLACTLIFPPASSCGLAGGETLFAMDIGGGLEIYTAGHTFVRFDVGDEIVRLPGPARDRDNQVHDDAFFRHDARVAIGGGWRF